MVLTVGRFRRTARRTTVLTMTIDVRFTKKYGLLRELSMAAKKKMIRKTTVIPKSSKPITARTAKKGAPPALNDTHPDLFPVVGIGASAGGLEAFTDFFRAMRTPCGMAFVVVSHLDPDHKSALTEILSHTTPMSVNEVSNGDELLPDRVYVIPPNRNLVVEGNRLRLVPRGETRGPHMPIDILLRSLAIARKNRAVGVILSGTATDGTLGLKAIKSEGGITFAQDNTAKHDGMPRSAVNAGCVDFVLPPAQIANELLRLSKHPSLNGGQPEAPSVAPAEKEDDFNTVVRLLSAAVGVDFTHYKPPTLRRRIERRMVLSKQPTLKEYAQYLKDNPTELQTLFQEVLIQVTGFFRDPEMFVALRETVFPKLLENRSADATLRIWVPGCSTGEEVYSLAICLLEFLGDQAFQTPVKIFATDIANRAIEIARAGEYPDSIAADVSPERLRRFFVKTDGRYQIQKPVRDLCVFARQDVTKDPPFSQIDLVSCRNLLIYLGPVLQHRVLPIFHYALRPNGFLVLGESESVGNFAELFNAVDKAHRFYLRKESSRRLTFDLVPGRTSGTGLTSLELPDDPGRRLLDVQREADRVVLAKYAPAGVVVDDDLQIVQFRGHTGLYLEPAPGTPNLDLLQMAREGLMVDLRKAIDQAKRDGVSQRRERVLVKTDGHTQEITLEVLPILIPASGKRFFVVLFARSVAEVNLTNATGLAPVVPALPHYGSQVVQKRGNHPGKRGGVMEMAELAAREREVERLQQELDATKGYLQSVIEAQEAANEELKAANEEIVSSNEELQSTNEELETAKEELQATNEELTTVNDELQNRIMIAAQLSDDLSNLIDSVNIPTVVLGLDLHIRRFSPSAQRVLSLIPTDIGRHIGDFKLKINVPDLEPLIQQVLDTLEVQHREVEDDEGRWHKLIVRPYKTLDNKIDGAIITLSDIDALKRREQELQESRDYAVSIVETVRQPLLILDGELRVRMANRAFYEMFRVTPSETERQLVFTLGNGQWNIPRLRLLLEDVLPHNSHFEDFDVVHDFPVVGQRSMLLNARRVRFDGTLPPHILLAIEDITDRLKAVEALRETQERMAAIVNTAVEGIVTIDEQGLIDFVNPSALQMFGYAADELLGQNVKLLMPSPTREEHDGYLENYLRTGVKKIIGMPREVVGLRRDGTVFPIALSISELHDGRQRLFTGVLRDISDRKIIEKEVLESVADEQRRIGQDLHDGTGQELTGLGFLAQELAESLHEKSLTEAIAARKIVEGLDRALKQIRQVSKGLIPVDVSAEGLMVALGDLADSVTSQSKVKCRFTGPVPIYDNQTATHLYRIAQEAITNALKHSRANHITVSLEAHNGGVTLSIRDDGIGLVDQADTASGMGLKIMRYRASLIGATFSVETADDGGTLVTCTVGKEHTS